METNEMCELPTGMVVSTGNVRWVALKLKERGYTVVHTRRGRFYVHPDYKGSMKPDDILCVFDGKPIPHKNRVVEVEQKDYGSMVAFMPYEPEFKMKNIGPMYEAVWYKNARIPVWIHKDYSGERDPEYLFRLYAPVSEEELTAMIDDLMRLMVEREPFYEQLRACITSAVWYSVAAGFDARLTVLGGVSNREMQAMYKMGDRLKLDYLEATINPLPFEDIVKIKGDRPLGVRLDYLGYKKVRIRGESHVYVHPSYTGPMKHMSLQRVMKGLPIDEPNPVVIAYGDRQHAQTLAHRGYEIIVVKGIMFAVRGSYSGSRDPEDLLQLLPPPPMQPVYEPGDDKYLVRQLLYYKYKRKDRLDNGEMRTFYVDPAYTGPTTIEAFNDALDVSFL